MLRRQEENPTLIQRTSSHAASSGTSSDLSENRVSSMINRMTARNERPEPDQEDGKRGSLWRTALLLTTSAVFGGIAVAIWNRRTLARIRQEITSAATPQVSRQKDPSGANVPD